MNENSLDKNFDSYAMRLKKNIYGSLKGKIRLTILLNDLDMFLDSSRKSLNVLDAGGGFGLCALALAQRGHKVTLCDISEKMMAEAKTIFQNQGIENAQFIHQSIQNHAMDNVSQYDLILCHAVLEWTENSLKVLECLKKMLKTDGYLSLMFFNRNGTIFKSVLRGNFYPKNNEYQFGQRKTLTPTNPLQPQTVYQWLEELNFKMIEKSGVRIFYDYCEKAVREGLMEEQVLACEKSFSKTEPFLSMARYIHVVCQKAI